jgi:TolB protein
VLVLTIIVVITAGIAAYLWFGKPSGPVHQMAFVVGEIEVETDLYIADQRGRGRSRLTDTAQYDLFPAWSPDGNRLAFVRIPQLDGTSPREGWNEAGIYLMDFREAEHPSEELLARALDAGVGAPSWSPDGRVVAILSPAPFEWGVNADGSALTLMDAETRATITVPLTVTVEMLGRGPSWSPSGTALAFSGVELGPDGDPQGMWAWVYDLGGRTLKRLIRVTTPVAWSPAEDFIACHDPESGASVSLVSPSGSVARTLGDVPQVHDLAWAPDGQLLAFSRESAGGPNEIVIVDLEEGGERLFQAAAEGMVTFLEWSSLGEYLAYSVLDGSHDQLLVYQAVIELRSGEQYLLPQTKDVEGLAAWRPIDLAK